MTVYIAPLRLETMQNTLHMQNKPASLLDSASVLCSLFDELEGSQVKQHVKVPMYTESRWPWQGSHNAQFNQTSAHVHRISDVGLVSSERLCTLDIIIIEQPQQRIDSQVILDLMPCS